MAIKTPDTKFSGQGKKQRPGVLMFCVMGIALNLICNFLAQAAGTLMYFDTVGTVLAAAVGGYLPGIVVGFATNIIKGIQDPSSVYYGVLNVLIALVVGVFSEKGWLKKPVMIVCCVLAMTFIGGGIGTIMPWFIDGVPLETESFSKTLYDTGIFSVPAAQLAANLLVDLADKTITMVFALIVLKILPDSFRERLHFWGWRQNPLSKEEADAAKNSSTRLSSMRTRIVIVLTVSLVAVAASATVISVVLYRKSITTEHESLAKGVAWLSASAVNGDMVDEFIEKGEEAEGYLETKQELYNIRDSYPDIEYVYVYKIMPDGCHVVFDLDTEELKGDVPGTVIAFDESFEPLLDDLLAGKEIDPITTDDTYGWLMTVYVPVKDSSGNTVCYAAADVSMKQLVNSERSFAAGVISLFLGFFIVIMAFVLWETEYSMTLPINSMALSAKDFAYNSEQARETTLEKIRDLEISTGDEIENLYYAFLRTTEDCVSQVTDIQEKGETILKMQKALVMVLADMVESRDQTTGDHVRKTAAYCGVIMRSLRRLGYYSEELTDQFISDVVNSAPLHDIGKIKVSDTILNKPGRLTDEEFKIMQTHTLAGAEIIDEVIEQVPDSGYLKETHNLALYHHEKWNGKGYPTGISGEDIPLSARIMAVADVFDALVSKRSYKEPFTFEKAMSIIEEGAGEHFDPKVAEAFIKAQDEVRMIAERFNELGGKYDSSFV